MKVTVYFGILMSGIMTMSFLMAGCGTSMPAKFYTLTSVAAQKPAEKGDDTAKNMAVAIGPVEIPEYLDRQEIVTRAEQNQLILSEFNLWGGSLKTDVHRVLIENTSYYLAAEGIPVISWKAGFTEAYRVPVQVVRFDGSLNDSIVLKARWAIAEKEGRSLEHFRESNITVPVKGGSYGSVVAAMSEALGELSREIAEGISTAVKNN